MKKNHAKNKINFIVIAFILSGGITAFLVYHEINMLASNVDFYKRELAIYEEFNMVVNEDINVCSTNTFKSYMDYRKITSVNSDQYKLQSKSITNEFTGIREKDEHLLVAMAETYGPIGTRYVIKLSSHQIINVIIGDIKANTTCTHSDGSMLEFIVDVNLVPYNVKLSGNYNEVFVGSIVSISKEN